MPRDMFDTKLQKANPFLQLFIPPLRYFFYSSSLVGPAGGSPTPCAVGTSSNMCFLKIPFLFYLVAAMLPSPLWLSCHHRKYSVAVGLLETPINLALVCLFLFFSGGYKHLFSHSSNGRRK